MASQILTPRRASKFSPAVRRTAVFQRTAFPQLIKICKNTRRNYEGSFHCWHSQDEKKKNRETKLTGLRPHSRNQALIGVPFFLPYLKPLTHLTLYRQGNACTRTPAFRRAHCEPSWRPEVPRKEHWRLTIRVVLKTLQCSWFHCGNSPIFCVKNKRASWPQHVSGGCSLFFKSYILGDLAKTCWSEANCIRDKILHKKSNNHTNQNVHDSHNHSPNHNSFHTP